jgi:DNA invertase Pin-like site-specific DNA recombinase
MKYGGSAFHGKHKDDKAVLGQFLHDARTGRVPRGSYLIIENLDRLSREEERDALRLWMDILDAGVNIVQLQPETVFRHDKSDMVDIIRAIIELSRGHSESRMKSVRSLANWERALAQARSQGRIMTGRLPGWIDLDDQGQPRLVEDRAAVIGQIFEWARAGYGFERIVKQLIEARVPAFGDRVIEHDEDGVPYFRRNGGRYGCGEWRTSYVRSILRDRRVLGELQPRDRHGTNKGEPIARYYPPVVSDETFYAAQAAIKARRGKPGRIGAGVASLFGGLLTNARDGMSYYVSQYTYRGAACKRLLNHSAIEKKSPAYTFPYAVFERALLDKLREVSALDVLGHGPTPDAEVLQGQLDWLNGKAAEIVATGLGNIPELAEKLRELIQQRDEIKAKLEKAKEDLVKSPGDNWSDVRSLAELLEETPAADREEVRFRLRTALARAIDKILILVVRRGRDNLCAAQVWFEGGRAHRDYLIFFRPALVNSNVSRPSSWWVLDFKSTGQQSAISNLTDLPDVRNADHVRRALAALQKLDLADVG